jgi:lipoprotein-releasing system permease protein
MQVPFEFLVGLRYMRASRRAGRRDGFISFISALSVTGIGLGVAALIAVLSVMNGFQKEVRDRMLGVLSHIEIFAARGAMSDWPRVLADIKKHPLVIDGAPFVAGQAMLSLDSSVRGVIVRGIDPSLEPRVTELAQRMAKGQLENLTPGSFGVALGRELASQWLLSVGDRVTLIAPQGTATPAGFMPRLRQLTVVAVFDSGHYEYDSSLLLMHHEDASRLFRVDGVSGIRLLTRDMMAAPAVARELARALPADLLVRDWSSENRNWFAAVQIEKRMMFIILTLIIAVAAFNLVSMLVMTVTDKQADIAILRTIGASPASIMKIFIIQGSGVGLLGTLLGVIAGTLLALNVGPVVATVESWFGLQVLPKGVYFIDHLPSDLHVADVLRIGLTSCVLALASTIYPSLRAASVRPAEALRYE